MRLPPRVPWALILLAAVCACRDPQLVNSEASLSADKDTLLLGPVYVGAQAEGEVTLISAARYSLALTLEVEGPFELTRSVDALEAGEQRALALRFSPTETGTVEGALVIRTKDQALRVALRGEALAWLPCPAEEFCRPRRFDPLKGACIDEPRPDGTSCDTEGLCLKDARCVAGHCLGQAVSCDDGNECTADACEPARGCVHFDSSARCPSNPDPCQVPLCDPKKGCAFVDAEDGVRCGPSDCAKANVCLLGKCSEVPVTEGASCGDASPCQRRGICKGAVCERPPVQTMTPLWEIRAKPGATLQFDSIADSQGNLYWRECSDVVEVVSVTRDGALRYRVPTQGICQSEGMVLLDGTVVLRTAKGVQAFQGFGGAPLWNRSLLGDVMSELPPTPAGATLSGFVQHLSRGVPGTTVLALEVYWNSTEGGSTFHGTWLISLDLFTGELRWKTRLPNLFVEEMLVDEMSNLYLGTVQRDTFVREFFGYTPQGALRWRKVNGFDHPAAVYGGRIYHWNQALSDTATGTEVGRVTLGSTVGYPRLTLGAGFYVTGEEQKVPSCTEPGQQISVNRLLLQKYDPATGKGAWSYEIVGLNNGGPTITNTLLTNRGSILFSQSRGRCVPESRQFVLREISAAGEEVYQCPLPGPESYEYFGLLIDDLWAASFADPTALRTEGVRAFAVPGLSLGSKGWVAALGSMSRDHRPR